MRSRRGPAEGYEGETSAPPHRLVAASVIGFDGPGRVGRPIDAKAARVGLLPAPLWRRSDGDGLLCIVSGGFILASKDHAPLLDFVGNETKTWSLVSHEGGGDLYMPGVHRRRTFLPLKRI